MKCAEKCTVNDRRVERNHRQREPENIHILKMEQHNSHQYNITDTRAPTNIRQTLKAAIFSLQSFCIHLHGDSDFYILVRYEVTVTACILMSDILPFAFLYSVSDHSYIT